MTTRSVRIPREVDELLVAAAEAERISVDEAVVQAVESWVRTREHRTRVRALTARVMAEDEELLTRLADA